MLIFLKPPLHLGCCLADWCFQNGTLSKYLSTHRRLYLLPSHQIATKTFIHSIKKKSIAQLGHLGAWEMTWLTRKKGLRAILFEMGEPNYNRIVVNKDANIELVAVVRRQKSCFFNGQSKQNPFPRYWRQELVTWIPSLASKLAFTCNELVCMDKVL